MLVQDAVDGGMSSSSSCPRGADILDLDRYMRASRPAHHHTRDRLIVDAGGADRMPLACSSVDSMRSPRGREHTKRYSHDSGLSDDSYVKKRHRSHRRSTEAKRVPSRVGSKSSVREFRAACEQVLREQQEQIARVTELCQKLVQPQVAHMNTAASCAMPMGQAVSDRDRGIVENKQISSKQQAAHSLDHNKSHDQAIQQTQSNIKEQQTAPSKLLKQNFGQNVKPVEPTDSSDSSTSNSSKELRKKEKLRSDSCKTYKIIMNKLDQLNHLFAARRVPPPVVSPMVSPRRTVPLNAPSSECVSVSNKLVATEDLRVQKHHYNPTIQVFPVQTHVTRSPGTHSSRLSSCRGRRLAVAEAHNVDIPPEQAGDSQCDGGEGEGWNELPREFDLDDPVMLYAQAKRLQAFHARTRTKQYNRTSDKSDKKFDSKLGNKLDNELDDQFDSKSLCALCRFYWRALRRCITQQLFGTCS